MIVKNESSTLETCLNSAKKHLDEIIIVDTGSTDNTIEIAKKFTDYVYDFKWCNDFSAARNFSLKKAKGDWIIILDADEIINDNDWIKIKKIISENKYDAINLIQRSFISFLIKTIKNILNLVFIFTIFLQTFNHSFSCSFYFSF